MAATTAAIFLIGHRVGYFRLTVQQWSSNSSQGNDVGNRDNHSFGLPSDDVAAVWLGIPTQLSGWKTGWIAIATVASVFLLLLAEMMQYGKGPKGAIERTCGGIFVSVYVGLPMALLVSLRSLGDGNWGLAAILTMIAVTKSTDAGAYFSGKAFGKHKLIPRLSPGKTREGAVGGILIATIVAFVCLKWLFPAIAGGASGPVEAATIPGLDQPLWGALCLGPVLAITGMIGDLAESLVKRDSNAKDSGNLLPGLGGVWDVTDSLIAAVMPAFLCFVAGIAA